MGNPFTPFLLLSAVLFAIGTLGVVARRGAITMLMSIELMLNAANIALVSVARFLPAEGTPGALGIVDGQIVALFVLAIAAAEAAVGLALVIAIFRAKGTTDTDVARLLRW